MNYLLLPKLISGALGETAHRSRGSDDTNTTPLPYAAWYRNNAPIRPPSRNDVAPCKCSI